MLVNPLKKNTSAKLPDFAPQGFQRLAPASRKPLVSFGETSGFVFAVFCLKTGLSRRLESGLRGEAAEGESCAKEQLSP
jgi:hypothetical protein